MCAGKPSCAAGQRMERRKKGQEGSAVARCGVGLLFWVTRNGRRKRRKTRKSKARLPEVRNKEKDREVRRNVLGLERCV